jgi:hypothetical protein
MLKKGSTCVALMGAVLTMLVTAGVAEASKASTIHDGSYDPPEALVEQGKSADVGLTVIDHGTRLDGRTRYYGELPSVSCPLTEALQSAGFGGDAAYVDFSVPKNLQLAIKDGSFSYSGPAVVSSDFIASGDPSPGTIAIRGHFKTGKIVANKTIAVTGTISVSLCGTSIPATFSDVW